MVGGPVSRLASGPISRVTPWTPCNHAYSPSSCCSCLDHQMVHPLGPQPSPLFVWGFHRPCYLRPHGPAHRLSQPVEGRHSRMLFQSRCFCDSQTNIESKQPVNPNFPQAQVRACNMGLANSRSFTVLEYSFLFATRKLAGSVCTHLYYHMQC